MAEGETHSENILEQRLQRSNSHAAPVEDEKDLFKDIEELEDNVSTGPPSKPPTPAPGASSKYQDNDGADWDEGVDAKDDDIFTAPAPDAPQQAESAYVKSKMQELTTVKEQVESMKDNPNILTALGSVLDALRKQIESAYDNSKINEQDHSTLLERLQSVNELIASK
eukprot:Phypoly_transcript_12891.p2 GENE.Phypoly_transcript_12891~~Phypoly_transcript_12891.p2  ORF type:complete len:168 (+),score=54.45 Phypoly_transcript_12891:292-795(+)